VVWEHLFADSIPLVRLATLEDLSNISTELGLRVTAEDLPDYLGEHVMTSAI